MKRVQARSEYPANPCSRGKDKGSSPFSSFGRTLRTKDERKKTVTRPAIEAESHPTPFILLSPIPCSLHIFNSSRNETKRSQTRCLTPVPLPPLYPQLLPLLPPCHLDSSHLSALLLYPSDLAMPVTLSSTNFEPLHKLDSTRSSYSTTIGTCTETNTLNHVATHYQQRKVIWHRGRRQGSWVEWRGNSGSSLVVSNH